MTVAVSGTTATAAPAFPDVPEGAAFHEEVAWLAHEGITTGYADGNFQPYSAVNRDAMAAFMYRLAGSPAFEPPVASPFVDVTAASKFYKEITWLEQTGITTGFANLTYRPFEPVTRDAMAAFLYRLAGEPAFTAPESSPFADVTPSTKFYKEISWLAQTGISTGWSDNTYRPGWNIARNAMAAFLYRFDSNVGIGVTVPATPEDEPGVADDDGADAGDSDTNANTEQPRSQSPEPKAQDTYVSEDRVQRDQESGWTTFNDPVKGDIYYVSSSTGSDSNDGLSPQTAFKTLKKAFERYGRNGQYDDHVLLMRGDTFDGSDLNWSRYSGISADQPFVISTYGDSPKRPVIVREGSLTILGVNKHRAFVGFEMQTPNADPTKRGFDPDATGVALSFVGNNENLLFEDLKITFRQFNIQGQPGDPGQYASDVTLRRNVIANSWNANTCGGKGHAQGSFISEIRGLTIEENTYIQNGWNATGGVNSHGVHCTGATQFNHNIYLVSSRDVEIKDNIFLHGSSMGIKLSAYGPGESKNPEGGQIVNAVIENNFFSDSELGISMGGNGQEDYRFVNNTVRGNVFSELGSDNSTKRNFSWGLEILDNDGALVEDNYFVNSPFNTNSFAMLLGHDTNRGVVINNNTIYNYSGKQLTWGDANRSRHRDTTVTNNRFIQTDQSVAGNNARSHCLVNSGTVIPPGAKFSGNQYATPDSWFCTDRKSYDLDWWKANYEPTATKFTGQFKAPHRTLATYARELGFSSEAALEQAMLDNNSRAAWDPALTAAAVNDYIKDGFTAP